MQFIMTNNFTYSIKGDLISIKKTLLKTNYFDRISDF